MHKNGVFRKFQILEHLGFWVFWIRDAQRVTALKILLKNNPVYCSTHFS